jgi:catechol 2,3-dioxygenase
MTNIEWAELRVRDLALQERFYRELLDLEVVRREARGVELGVAGQTLLKLEHDPQAQVSDQAQPGLFHLAFLLPDAATLGGWLGRARHSRLRLEGASDHGVSRAIYLSDPENNGIEVYADRDFPRGGPIEMYTRALNIDGLLAQARPWTGAAGLRLGHIHLRSLHAQDGADWFQRLGMQLTVSYPGGEFYAADGYHHHFAVNEWGVRAPRPGVWTGLTGYALTGPFQPEEVSDPWGHRVSLGQTSLSSRPA